MSKDVLVPTVSLNALLVVTMGALVIVTKQDANVHLDGLDYSVMKVSYYVYEYVYEY